MGAKNYPKDTPSCDDQDYLSTVSKFTADDFTSCHSVATRDAESAEAETTTHHLEAGQEEPEESLDTVQIIEAGEEENQEKAGEEEVEQEEEPVVIRQCVRVEVSDSEEEEDEEEEEVPAEEQFRNNYRQVCSPTPILFIY